VFAAHAVSRWIEDTTGSSIRKFVRTARPHCTIEIQAGPPRHHHRRPSARNLREALAKINNVCPGAH
jgi:hypothetical protein